MVYEEITHTNDQDNAQSGQLNQPNYQAPQGSPVQGTAPSSTPAPIGPIQSFNQQNARPDYQQQKGSGGFTNIQKYVSANQPAAGQLGNQIQQNISNQANQTKQNIQNSQNQYNTQAGQINNVLGNTQNYAQQLGTDTGAQNIAGNTNDLQNFQNIYNASLTNPTTNYSNNTNDVSKIQALANLAGTETGRNQLLSQTFNNPNMQYNTGEQNFDQLLLQNTPGVAQNLLNAGQQQYNQTQNAYNQMQQAQDTSKANIANAITQNQQALQNAVGGWGANQQGALGGLYSNLTNAQQQGLTNEQSQLAALQKELTNQNGPVSNISAQDATALGMNPNMQTYGLDLSKFGQGLSVASPTVSLADVANQNQVAQLAALQSLAGMAPNSISLGQGGDRLGVQFGNDFNQALTQARNTQATNLAPNLGTSTYSYDYGQNINPMNYIDKNFYTNLSPAIASYLQGQETTPGSSTGLGDISKIVANYANEARAGENNPNLVSSGGGGMQTVKPFQSSQLATLYNYYNNLANQIGAGDQTALKQLLNNEDLTTLTGKITPANQFPGSIKT